MDLPNYIDINLSGSNIHDSILTEPLELFFQEIEVAVKILPNEIWGVKDSLNLSKYLFNKYTTLSQVKNDISFFINKHCSQAQYFNYEISISNLKNSASGSDLLYIVFTITLSESDKIQQKFLIG